MNSYYFMEQAFAAFFAHASVKTEATSYLSLFASDILPLPNFLEPAPVRSLYRDSSVFSYGGFDTPVRRLYKIIFGYPIPHSDVPYDYGLYAWPRVLYSPISSFHLGSYVWSPNACRFSNSSLFHVSGERSYPPKAPIFQINLQGVFNNYAGATINNGENSGNHYTYDNHGGNSIYNSGSFNGHGNGSSFGGDFDASTRNYY